MFFFVICANKGVANANFQIWFLSKATTMISKKHYGNESGWWNLGIYLWGPKQSSTASFGRPGCVEKGMPKGVPPTSA